MGADANTGVAMESKMTAGSEMEMVGVMGKSKETVGSEVETVVGMEYGVDTEAGMDLKLTADQSGAVAGAEASMGSVITTARDDVGVDMRSMVVGTATGDDAAVVAWTEVHTIVEMIPSVCIAASECAAQNCWNGNRAGRVIRGVYGSGNNSICLCGGR